MRWLALAVLVTACATPQQTAQRLPSTTLCYIDYAGTPDDRISVNAELARRGFVCTPQAVEMGRRDYAAMQMQRRANSQAVDEMAFRLLNPPQAPTVTCQTIRNGNIENTVCR